MNNKKPKLNFQEKLEILNRIEKGESRKLICEKYKCNKSTICRITQKRDEILSFVKSNYLLPKKIKKTFKVKVPETEKAIHNWFLNERLKKNNVNDELLRLKSLEFHKQLNPEINFVASSGWIQKFKRRHGIRSLKIRGEN